MSAVQTKAEEVAPDPEPVVLCDAADGPPLAGVRSGSTGRLGVTPTDNLELGGGGSTGRFDADEGESRTGARGGRGNMSELAASTASWIAVGITVGL